MAKQHWPDGKSNVQRREHPEKKGEKELRDYMGRQGWLTVKLAGSIFQKGLPDLLCVHPDHGIKFIEMKSMVGKLSDVQFAMFTRMSRFGAKIYICVNAKDYDKIFDPPNWKHVSVFGSTELPRGFGQRKGEER